MSDQLEKEIVAPVHFWLRIVAEFVKCAHRFESEIVLCIGDRCVKGRCMQDLLAFPVTRGSRFILKVKGSDAGMCMKTLSSCIENMRDPSPSSIDAPLRSPSFRPTP